MLPESINGGLARGMPVISLLQIPLMTVLLSVVDEMDFPTFAQTRRCRTRRGKGHEANAAHRKGFTRSGRRR